MSAAPRATLSMLQSARLITLIEVEYTSSGKNDVEFATYATEKLGFPVIRRHVTSRRDELGIPSHREANPSPDRVEVTAQVKELHASVDQLRKDYAALLALVEATDQRLQHVVKVLNLQKHFHEGKPR